jgi:hypothetical protein
LNINNRMNSNQAMVENQTEQSKEAQVEKYLDSLNELEKKTLEIAKSHLGTSFNLKKSVGFLKWKESQDKK